MKPERVYGVDFSGGKDAGKKIWVAGGEVVGRTLRLDVCLRAATLPNSSSERDRAVEALRKFMAQQTPCVVGLDFPFGLPSTLVEEERWEDFARNFASRYADPHEFRMVCTHTALNVTCRSDNPSTCRKELRRATDDEADTPFSPYNLRIYKMTYHGIRDVLAPLVDAGEAPVLPMQPAVPGRSWVLEICPASTLKRMGLSQSYKRRELAAARDAILAAVADHERIVVPDWVRAEVMADKEGDALDSVVAAVATFRALRESIHSSDPGEPGLVEGRVYV
jgi:hypothetical protein